MLRVRTVFTGVPGSPWLSTMYWADLETQDGANLAVARVGQFWTALGGQMKTTVRWDTEAEVDQLSVTGTLQGTYVTAPVGGNGLAADTLLPIATQALVRWSTSLVVAGRRLRGRTFLPGWTEAHSLNGVLEVAAKNTTQNAANTLIAHSAPSMVVWSPTHGTLANIDAASVWEQFAVLRSRRD
jgi:hypothetical protein